MKKRIALCCLLVVWVWLLAGCGANPAGTQLPDSTPSSETAAGEDTFTSEDMKTFTFEGEEYTFPLSYDVLTEQGWTVSEKCDDIFIVPSDPDEPVEAGCLLLENQQYPEIELWVYSQNNGGSVEELVDEFETNGIWGISICPKDKQTHADRYPDLSFKGVTFGSSAEDIVDTFGTDFGATTEEGSLYIYSTWFTEGGTDSCLYFELEDDEVYGIYASY